jgi:hypothetical protein
MTHRFAELMFTPRVKALQAQDGSRASYARFEQPGFPARDRLTEKEAAFIVQRDSFYMATVSETGWPYVQHRGGAPGFLKVIDARTLAFADYPGNRQFVSFGNMAASDRVALILMDYPNRRRLKLLGHGSVGPGTDEAARRVVIALEGFDWNCPQYITPRFTESDMAPLRTRLAELDAEVAALRGSSE